ncbi:MAG: flavodoxin family protein [Eubacteriaceae bacterium]|jgi:multimeric flavodoxin WrbA|nr:flavodoxin family protein [Eubacteriaceae bacterium]
MKVTILMGSQRPKGHSAQLVQYIKGKMPDAEFTEFQTRKMSIKHCIACDKCLELQGSCVLKDDEMHTVYRSLEACDALIIVSPVYFSAFPSPLKTLIDRCQMFYNLKDRSHIPDKKVLLVEIGGARHYKNQFVANYCITEWMLEDINGKLVADIGIPNTDRIPALENTEKMALLDEAIEKLKE